MSLLETAPLPRAAESTELAELRRLALQLPVTPAYAALLAEAERIGWPRVFQDDLLTHDRILACGGRPDLSLDRFVWVLRETGTHLYPPDPKPHSNGQDSRGWLQANWRTNGTGCRFYIWDGQALNEVDYEAARRCLCPGWEKPR